MSILKKGLIKMTDKIRETNMGTYLSDRSKLIKFNSDLIDNALNININDEYLKDILTEYFHNKVPTYFYTTSASQSGKYHPKYSLGEGGLVRHTISALNWYMRLKDLNIFDNSDLISLSKNYINDIICTSLLIHDTFKCGYTEVNYTVYSHPSIAANEFYKLANDYISKISDKSKSKNLNIILNYICDAVESHMGPWGRIQPKNSIDKIVSLCDYLSAQKVVDNMYDIDSLDINKDFKV